MRKFFHKQTETCRYKINHDSYRSEWMAELNVSLVKNKPPRSISDLHLLCMAPTESSLLLKAIWRIFATKIRYSVDSGEDSAEGARENVGYCSSWMKRYKKNRCHNAVSASTKTCCYNSPRPYKNTKCNQTSFKASPFCLSLNAIPAIASWCIFFLPFPSFTVFSRVDK